MPSDILPAFHIIERLEQLRRESCRLVFVSAVVTRQHVPGASKNLRLREGRPGVKGISALFAGSHGNGNLVVDDLAQVGTVDGELHELIGPEVVHVLQVGQGAGLPVLVAFHLGTEGFACSFGALCPVQLHQHKGPVEVIGGIVEENGRRGLVNHDVIECIWVADGKLESDNSPSAVAENGGSLLAHCFCDGFRVAS